jgi:group I intron endonuclease
VDKAYVIYKHTSPSNKVYIGQTRNIEKRWGKDGYQYLLKNKKGEYNQRLFARAIQKYGWNNFKHEIILEGLSKSEADYAEKYLIKWYKLHDQSYNITDGGEGVVGVERDLLPIYFDILECCGKFSSYSNGNYFIHNGTGFKKACRENGLDISNASIDNAISALCKKGFLIKKFRGEYLLNPVYFFRGKLSNRSKVNINFTVEPTK